MICSGPPRQFKDLHGHPGRDQALYLCRGATSLTLSELANTFGVNHDATLAMAIRRYKDALAKNPSERRMMEAAAEKLIISSRAGARYV